jgi:hypothetical protein
MNNNCDSHNIEMPQHPLKQEVASQILPTAMLPYLLACRLLKSFSAYKTVVQATDDPDVAKRFLSQLSESRRTSIIIVGDSHSIHCMY